MIEEPVHSEAERALIYYTTNHLNALLDACIAFTPEVREEILLLAETLRREAMRTQPIVPETSH